MYHSCDEFLEDLKIVQRSLAAANAKRSAYGPVQDLIWQTLEKLWSKRRCNHT